MLTVAGAQVRGQCAQVLQTRRLAEASLSWPVVVDHDGSGPQGEVLYTWPSLRSGNADFPLDSASPTELLWTFDGADWRSVRFPFSSQVTGRTRRLAPLAYDGRLIFPNLEVFDGAGWFNWNQRATGGTFPAGFVAKSMHVHAGQLFALMAAGASNGSGFAPGYGVYRWNGASWEMHAPMQVDLFTPTYPNARPLLRSFGTELVVIDTFRNVDGTLMRGTARWNGTAWLPMAGGLVGSIRDAIEYQGRLYVTGVAGTNWAPGSGAASLGSSIAMWDGTTWTGAGSGGGEFLHVYDGRLHSLSPAGHFIRAMDNMSWEVVPQEFTWTAATSEIIGGMATFQGELVGVLNAVNVDTTRGPSADFVYRNGVDRRLRPVPIYPRTSSVTVRSGRPVGVILNPSNANAIEMAEHVNGEWRRIENPLAENVGDRVRTVLGRTLRVRADLRAIEQFVAGTWSSLGTTFPPPPSFTAPTLDFAALGDDLFAFGKFGLRRWDGQAWADFGTPITGEIRAAAFYQGQIYIAGDFSVPSTQIADVARWNGSSWEAVVPAITPALQTAVNDLLVHDNRLWFTGANQQPLVFGMALGTWDGQTVRQWRALNAVGELQTWNKLHVVNQTVYVTRADRGSVARFANDALTTIFDRPLYATGGPATLVGTEIQWNLSVPLSPGDKLLERFVIDGPIIYQQPQSITAPCGETSTFVVVTSEENPGITFRWSRDGFPLSDGTTPAGSIVHGSRTSRLRISATTLADAGAYTCEVVSCTTRVTQAAALAVTGCAPTCDSIDFNNNQVFPEEQDVIDFFSVLAGGPCSAGNTCNDIDFNNNQVFPEERDVLDFLNTLAGGACP